MAKTAKNILILADIEGSSLCRSYAGSSFMTAAWREACLGMTADIDAVVRALFEAGVEKIQIKDFHRTAYNLLPERIDGRARVISGYRRGPVPGIGHPGPADAVMLIGMHAASGTHGFLAHTLTSRIAALTVNGKKMAEVSLFSASLAPFGIAPIFFSGCPVACNQARAAIPGIHTHAIDKQQVVGNQSVTRWRSTLVAAAIASLTNTATKPFNPRGPFTAWVTMRDGQQAAAQIAHRWGVVRRGASLRIEAHTFQELYHQLIRLLYLTPFIQHTLPISLGVYNLIGRLGLVWVRKGLSHRTDPSPIII